MNDRERRHAMAINEAHVYFGGLENETHRERLARLAFVKRVDGEWPAKEGAAEMAAEYRRRRAAE